MKLNCQQARCLAKTDPRCRKAGGNTFLVLTWLPWTIGHCCRKCAELLNPELIKAVESGAYRPEQQTSPKPGAHSSEMSTGDLFG